MTLNISASQHLHCKHSRRKSGFFTVWITLSDSSDNSCSYDETTAATTTTTTIKRDQYRNSQLMEKHLTCYGHVYLLRILVKL